MQFLPRSGFDQRGLEVLCVPFGHCAGQSKASRLRRMGLPLKSEGRQLMATRLPIVRSISWWGVMVLAIYVLMLFGTVGWLGGQGGVLWAMFLVIGHLAVARMIINHSAVRGLRALKKGEYESAIEHFKASYDFFSMHRWVDDFRAVTLMQPSYMTHREMAMLNIAFGCVQIGSAEAIHWYQKCVKEYPENMAASSALKLMEIK